MRHSAEHVPGVDVLDMRARWIGHRLHADLSIAVDRDQPVGEATQLAVALRNELMAHVPALRTVTISFAAGVKTHSHVHHHAPEPFMVAGDLAKGQLAIVDTPRGERFRLSVTQHVAGLHATVVIDRQDGPETLFLATASDDHHVLESAVAPAEPHEFSAELILAAGTRMERLSFKMTEPTDHHH
jgi:hypothetical protein